MKNLVFAIVAASPAMADPPVIEAVSLQNAQASVTVSHPDTGWDHYADVWRILAPDGTELAERILVHPHVSEQPFTRSTAFVAPPDIDRVQVVAGCTNGDVSEAFEVLLAEN